MYNPSYGIRTDEKYYILRFSEWNFPDYKYVSGIHGLHLVESTKEETIHVGGKEFRAIPYNDKNNKPKEKRRESPCVLPIFMFERYHN